LGIQKKKKPPPHHPKTSARRRTDHLLKGALQKTMPTKKKRERNTGCERRAEGTNELRAKIIREIPRKRKQAQNSELAAAYAKREDAPVGKKAHAGGRGVSARMRSEVSRG